MYQDKCRILVWGYCCSCTVGHRHQSLKLFLQGVSSVPRVSLYFITSWDTSGHNWWYLPLVWLPPRKHTHTPIHIHIDAHGHINLWRHHLFSHLTLPSLAGPWTWQRSDISLLSAQYSRGASDQKSDRIEFYYSHECAWMETSQSARYK